MVECHYNKGIDMLELGCTLFKPANICLHSSTCARFHPFTESDKDYLSHLSEDVFGGLSVVLKRKAVVDETHICKSTKVCKSIGIIASQLYLHSMCQPMPTRLHTRYEFDADLQRFKPHQIKSRSYEKMLTTYSQRIGNDCRIERFYTTGT